MIGTKFALTLVIASFSSCYAGSAADDNWRRALPGAEYTFPTDHAIHEDFKTEWWYFTGTLKSDAGKDYGYELTFFRQGVLPPALRVARSGLADGARSRFVQNDFKFAHFAISDLSGRKFHFAQRINRGAFGDAGFGDPAEGTASIPSPAAERLAWIDNWSLRTQPDGSWKITAQTDVPTAMWIDLDVTPTRAPVIEGSDGISQKAAGAGNASYYYSYTRLKTRGTLTLDGDKAHPVTGESWFDHEWASNQLASDQVGWDWFCFQFEDQTELMLYAMRRRDGSVDPVSSGTWVASDGRVEHLKSGDFTLRATRTWRSKQTGAVYPIGWQVSIPSQQVEFTVASRLDDQELVLPPITYWEGAIRATGHRGTQTLTGQGYMELTGYAEALKALQEPRNTEDTRLRGTPR